MVRQQQHAAGAAAAPPVTFAAAAAATHALLRGAATRATFSTQGLSIACTEGGFGKLDLNSQFHAYEACRSVQERVCTVGSLWRSPQCKTRAVRVSMTGTLISPAAFTQTVLHEFL